MSAILKFLKICILGVYIVSCNDEEAVEIGEAIDSDQQLIEINSVSQAWGNWFSSHFILSDGNHFYFQERTAAISQFQRDGI